MELETIIFDFDLTLMDLKLVESTDWMKVRKEIASYYNSHGIPGSVTTQYGLPVGLYKGIHKTEKDRFSEKKFYEMQKKASELVKEKYERKGLKNAVKISHAEEILEWVNERDLKVGVVSLNSEEIIEEAADRGGIKKYIDTFYGRDSGGDPKPAVDQIVNCLDEFGTDSDFAMMVGDSPSDIEVSNKAGLVSVALKGDYYSDQELAENNPDYTINGLMELKKIIEK